MPAAQRPMAWRGSRSVIGLSARVRVPDGEVVGAGLERSGSSELLAAEGGHGGGRIRALTLDFSERGHPHSCEPARFLGHICRP
jgi:hypothetical protein